ncbi:DUF6635 family protein [uncultured Gilvimarinus sp.]|uniref:DUF6635 family protein n=1 Tax=uncultured Gilvimarinus sp. TaxID=1689143 RepID=UPI0030EB1CBB|tara:strand:+ start:1104 stop:2045 length:942 start_codon:yes stop_codon:yes gene_type:complete
MSQAPPITDDRQALLAAIERGVADYFTECRARIPGFVKQHFRYPGAWHTNRRALGWDMLRAPLNLMWVPFYLFFQALAWLSKRCRLRWVARQLRRVPIGMQTNIQRYLVVCAERELLLRGTDQNRLRECIVAAIVEREQFAGLEPAQEQALQQSLDDALAQYALTRTASADISNTLFATLAGAFTLQKFTPGGIAIGITLASVVANRWAAWDFFLGPVLGGWYYSVFPVAPEASLIVLSTASVMALMAVFACFSGLISDPVQSITGIHQRRLRRMLDGLERDVIRRTSGSFRPKDAYLARLMDIIDAARVSMI